MFKRPFSKDINEVEVTVSFRTLFKLFAFTLVAILLVGALKQASHALLLVFTALFLALALNAPVSWIARHLPGRTRDSRAVATSVSAIIVLGILGLFIASLVPPVVRQTQSFINSAPQIVNDLRSGDSEAGKFIQRYGLQDQVDNFSKQLSNRLKNASGSAVSTLTKVGSSVFSTLTIIVLTFMMLAEGPRWILFMRELLPTKHEERVSRLTKDMYRVVKGFVNGQVLLAAIAAVMLLPGLIIFDVSYPVALLGVVFICGLIPMVGHTIGAAIVTLVALFTSPVSALGILIYYIVYQQIENYLVQPRVQANSTEMSPHQVFVAVVVGVSFGGLFGGLVAIPIAGCLRVLVIDYLQMKNFIDTPVVRDEVKKATT
jgi:predicted PurR-regulated permease PerM